MIMIVKMVMAVFRRGPLMAMVTVTGMIIMKISDE